MCARQACAAMALRRGMHGTGGRCPVCREVVRVVEPDTEGDGSGVGGSTEAIRVRREGIEYRLRFERGEDVLRHVRTTFGVPCGVPVKLVRGGAVLDADAVATAVTKGKPMHLVSASESPADERAQRSRAYWGAWRTYLAYIFARGLELATDTCRGLPAALSLFFRSAVSQGVSRSMRFPKAQDDYPSRERRVLPASTYMTLCPDDRSLARSQSTHQRRTDTEGTYAMAKRRPLRGRPLTRGCGASDARLSSRGGCTASSCRASTRTDQRPSALWSRRPEMYFSNLARELALESEKGAGLERNLVVAVAEVVGMWRVIPGRLGSAGVDEAAARTVARSLQLEWDARDVERAA